MSISVVVCPSADVPQEAASLRTALQKASTTESALAERTSEIEELKQKMVRFDEMRKDCEKFEAQVVTLQAELASVSTVIATHWPVFSRPVTSLTYFPCSRLSLNAAHLTPTPPYLVNPLQPPFTLHHPYRALPTGTTVSPDSRQVLRKATKPRCTGTTMLSKN